MKRLSPTHHVALMHRLHEHIKMLCEMYGAEDVEKAYGDLDYPFEDHKEKDNRHWRGCENLFIDR